MNCAKGNFARRCLGVGLMAAVGIAVLGWVVMLLWNALLPSLFAGVAPVGYGQALGLLLLCKILFGGFHVRGGRRRKGRDEHWERLSEQERAQFAGHFKTRWGRCCGTGQGNAQGDGPAPADAGPRAQ